MSDREESAAEEWQRERYGFTSTPAGSRAGQLAARIAELAEGLTFEELGRQIASHDAATLGRLACALLTQWFSWRSGKRPAWLTEQRDVLLQACAAADNAAQPDRTAGFFMNPDDDPAKLTASELERALNQMSGRISLGSVFIEGGHYGWYVGREGWKHSEPDALDKNGKWDGSDGHYFPTPLAALQHAKRYGYLR